VEKKVSGAIFTSALPLQTCTNRYACANIPTYKNPVNNAERRHHTLLASFSLGKPIQAVLCCSYITESSSEAK